MKIALVHDDFVQAGGAESLFATIASLWPDAQIYTSLVDWSKLPQSIARRRIKTSFIQIIPFANRFYKALLPLYPLAFESFKFDDFDLVISSTTRFAKSIITKPGTVHICYINSTPRFLWDQKTQEDYLPKIAILVFKPLLWWLARWDRTAASRPDHYIANSHNVAGNIKKFYNRDSQVIYPYVDLNYFKPAKIHNWQLRSQNYFLVVSRLVKWKKIEIVIKAAKELGINLKVVGKGPDEKRLKKIAIDDQLSTLDYSVEFLGKVTKDILRNLYQNCQALIVTQEEDFGIATVEAQACGNPVVAYKSGGQNEIIKDKITGLLFERQTAESLKDAIEAASHVKWSVSACRQNAMRFSKVRFIKGIKKAINQKQAYAPKS